MRYLPEAMTPEETFAALIEAAAQAPSIHNSQPWSFGVRGSRLTFSADTDRRLDVADPDGREMLISCGAALFTLRLAARHLGRVAEMSLWPDPDRPTLLADVDVSRLRPVTNGEERMFEQVAHRRTHRGGFTAERPDPGLLATLSIEAGHEGGALRIIADPRACQALAALSEAAERTWQLDPGYQTELARWAPAPGGPRRDGVHADAYPRIPGRTDPQFADRDFARGKGWGHDDESPDVTGDVALLTTAGDTRSDHVAAGMALQRMLLRATEAGVSAAFHTQALEIPELRSFIRTRFCGGAHPQMLMRLGRTAGDHGAGVRRAGADVTRRTS